MKPYEVRFFLILAKMRSYSSKHASVAEAMEAVFLKPMLECDALTNWVDADVWRDAAMKHRIEASNVDRIW